MSVTFANINLGEYYSRPELARLWGYSGYQALARGVVTPRNDNKIILFVTSEKQEHLEQYNDKLVGDTLYWEGPTDHFAEDRLVNSASLGDEIHLFYRDRHHSAFRYEGEFTVIDCHLLPDQPSRFVFRRRS